MTEHWDKESVYDELISPLMTQIIAICKEHQIPLVAQFQYADTAEDGPAYCTTTLPFPNASEELRTIAAHMKPQPAVAFAETTTTTPDGSRMVSIRRVT